MISIYELKPKFQALLRPLCARLAAAGVTANQVTLSAFALSLVLGAAIALTKGAPLYLLLLAPVLFIRMAMNAIDGMLAREFDQKSPLGAILNELTDVLSDAALYLPFALIAGVNAALVVVLVLLAMIAEMTGVVAVQVGAERRYDGPFGKSDRAFFFGALGVGFAIVSAPGLWSDALLALAIVLSILTIFNRAKNALKNTLKNTAGEDRNG
ncbi:MAG: CDP-alcohol phosphatidyltransferase [Hyphococcus sp.]|nr:MAG: CDP-alcohol phosphatidyltransferase [Marinicaulis sp.]